ncbi:hypothetical protein BP6252_03476 [Coleophoma cylindrospora]|uniref:FAD-binding domain-containing protein n=1 Tax=Coleophoma cylindrospora TaxID=1849047 RepID=A0A3D8S8F2_9HELO|nr:hypothetical protein BP6252_03476 [Coleophoma cylindrospora]
MRAIVVGAGIAGLSSAIGLRRAGHEVLILEKSSMLQELGAAINVCPNASRVLLQWGFSPSRARLVTARTAAFIKGDTLDLIDEQVYVDMEGKFGAPFYFAHRVDLHSELKHLATREEGGVGKPAVIELRKDVVGYDADGTVMLADGSSMKADLVVGADGLHSEAVKAVIATENEAHPTGLVCFRFLLSTQELLDDPKTAPLMENHDGRFRSYVDPAGKRLIWYPCRENTVQSMAIIARERKELRTQEGTSISSRLTQILPEFMLNLHRLEINISEGGRSETVEALLSKATTNVAYGKIGPIQGQAGAQAIEDGAALEKLFANFTNTDAKSIAARLESFENVRRNRASAMQIFSNASQDEAERVREAARQYVPAGDHIPSNPKEYTQYNFSHDVFAACQKELDRIAIVA